MTEEDSGKAHKVGSPNISSNSFAPYHLHLLRHS